MYSENDAPGRIAGMHASVTATLSVTTLKSPIAPRKEPNVEFMLITEKDYQNIGVAGKVAFVHAARNTFAVNLA